MRSLVFATNNQYKTAEVNKLLQGKYEVLNLSDIGCETDIPETGSSFAENANLKSHYVAANYQMDCFADDSGLEVEALNNEPGILSARYSGVRDDRANLLFLLDRLKGEVNRAARFKTVISLVQGGETFLFEGVIEGTIREVPVGDQGFGYDPVFDPLGYEQTFAEMSMAQKNEISHRAIAMRKLIAFLKEQV